MASNKTVKSLPSSETVWMQYRVSDTQNYFITSNRERTMYYLWKRSDDGYTKIARSTNPNEFQY